MMDATTSYVVCKDLGREGIWQGRGPQLPRLDMELTERCNNNCIHCYINQPQDHQPSRDREMSTATVKNILDQAAALGCLSVRFTGGEPLLRGDFQEIYLYTRRKGMKVALLTNATLISPELTALFKRYPPGEPVEITLYGMQEQSYAAVSRTSTGFAAAMRGVSLLVENRIPILLKFIRLPQTEGEIDAFLHYSRQHSVGGKAGSISMEFNLRGRRDNNHKNQRIKDLRSTPQQALTILAQDGAAYTREMQLFAERFMRPGGAALFNCGCGKGGAVDAQGRLQPCLLLRHPELVYDLNTGSIRDALDRFFPEVLSKQAEDPRYLERCATCFLQGLCNQCPAWSWMENGTLDTPVEYLCQIAHQQACFLGLITEEEKAWQVRNWQERINRFVQEKAENHGRNDDDTLFE